MQEKTSRKQSSQNRVYAHQYTKRLARHLQFTPNDLFYNRQGRLSARQVKKLRNRLIQSLAALLVGFLIVTVGVGVILITPWAREIIDTQGIFADLSQLTVVDWSLIFGGGVMLILFAMMLRKIMLSPSKDQQHVYRYIGYANRDVVEFSNRPSYRDDKYFYYLTIDDHHIEVDGELYKLCQKNFVYASYVAPAFNDIIAMEVVDDKVRQYLA